MEEGSLKNCINTSLNFFFHQLQSSTRRVKMSFFRITNPNAMVADYTATIKRLRERNFAERVGDSNRRRELQEQWEPVIRSNEKVAENLIKDLKPIKEEMEELNRVVKREDRASYFKEFKARVLSRDPEVDTSFGFRFRKYNHGK